MIRMPSRRDHFDGSDSGPDSSLQPERPAATGSERNAHQDDDLAMALASAGGS